MDTEVKLTASQIKKMQHALGMDSKKPKRGKYEAYRNYYNSSIDNPELEELVQIGYMIKRSGSAHLPGVWYHVSDNGIKYLEDLMNLKITESK